MMTTSAMTVPEVFFNFFMCVAVVESAELAEAAGAEGDAEDVAESVDALPEDVAVAVADSFNAAGSADFVGTPSGDELVLDVGSEVAELSDVFEVLLLPATLTLRDSNVSWLVLPNLVSGTFVTVNV